MFTLLISIFFISYVIYNGSYNLWIIAMQLLIPVSILSGISMASWPSECYSNSNNRLECYLSGRGMGRDIKKCVHCHNSTVIPYIFHSKESHTVHYAINYSIFAQFIQISGTKMAVKIEGRQKLIVPNCYVCRLKLTNNYWWHGSFHNGPLNQF